MIRKGSMVRINCHNKYGGLTGRVIKITTLFQAVTYSQYPCVKRLRESVNKTPKMQLALVLVDGVMIWHPLSLLTQIYQTKGIGKFWVWKE